MTPLFWRIFLLILPWLQFGSLSLVAAAILDWVMEGPRN